MVAESPNISTSKTGERAEVNRLMKCVAASDRALKKARSLRRQFAREYAGPYYGKGAKDVNERQGRQPLSLLLSLVDAMLAHLAINPRCSIKAQRWKLRSFANLFKLRVDHRLEEINAESVAERAILEALFGLAVFKTGIAKKPGTINDPEGWLADPGEPYTDLVDLDDYVCEMQARRREAMSYEGNRYRVPLDWAHEAFVDGRDEIDKLAAKAEGAKGKPRASDLSVEDRDIGAEEWVPRVELLELWLPYTDEVATVGANEDVASRYLERRPYDGPEGGPYDVLSFNDVPGNLLPTSRLSAVFDLHILINEMARKEARQAEREKVITVVDPSVQRLGDEIKNANDGQIIFGNPDRVKQLQFGGGTETGYQAAAWFYDWFNRISGNLDVLGGMQSRSPTLGQEQMLLQSAGAIVGRMRKRNLACWKSIIRKHAWHVWVEEGEPVEMIAVIEGGYEIPVRWNPDRKEGDFLDYGLGLEAYGIRNDDPLQQYQRIQQWITETILPMAQLGASQGVVLDVRKVAKLTGEKLDIPEAEELFMPGPAMPGPELAGQHTSETTNISMGGRQRPEPGAMGGRREARREIA